MIRHGADDAYQQMIDRLPAGVLVHGGDGGVVFANPAAARIAGFEHADDMVGHPIAELLPPPFLRGLRTRLLEGDGPAGRVAVPLRRRDGTRVFVDVSEVPYVAGAEVLVQLSFTEVPDPVAEQTTLRRTEALQAEHLDALGRLAGGVAHEMNNVFGAIMAEATVTSTGAPDAAQADLGVILDAAQRGGAVTADLLGFAQGGLYQPERLDVGALLERAAARARERASVSISILDVVEVEGDARQLDAALDAVIENAAEATPAGAAVSLVLRRALGGPPETDLAPGSYARIEVDDHGVGPTDEARRRAFEPYFTTRGDARRGLGLSTVYGVVRHHGGLVSLTARPGGGARVTLYLPEAPPRPQAAPTVNTVVSGGPALVVDDDDAMRKASQRLVASLGYEAVGARDGVSAIEACAATRFVFVLLDLRMPGLSGTEVLARLRATDPDVRVILYTGFERDETVRAALEPGRVGFLQKPFRRGELEQQIQLVRR